MATLTRGTPRVALLEAAPQAPIERDTTTDALVAELRAVIADMQCERAEPDAPTNEAGLAPIEPRRDWLARGLKFWCL